jgi:hypothetical protein
VEVEAVLEDLEQELEDEEDAAEEADELEQLTVSDRRAPCTALME